MPADAYFCSEKDVAKLTESVTGRLSELHRGRDVSGWESVYRHLFDESLWLERDGAEGELLAMKVAKAKALLQSLTGLILGAPLSWHPSARNSDVEARGAVLMATNLCEFLWKQHGLGIFCGEWILGGLAFRESYALPTWDMGMGKPVGVSGDYSAGGGQLLFGGGLRIRNVLPWDVFFDPEYRSWEELPWVCVRTWENKHRLAALEPVEERKEAIRSLNSDWMDDNQRRRSVATSPDVVALYHLWHKDSPEVPGGLYLPFLSPQLAMQAAPCSEIPLERFAPSTRLDSPFGDSQWQGTLKIEEMLDTVHSALASNLAAFGVQSITMDERDGVSRDKQNNLQVFERRPGSQFEPRGTNHVQQPQGAEKHVEMWDAAALDIVGLNDVSQGAPQTAQMNAEAFTLLASMAVQRNGGVQRRALDSIGKLGGKTLRLLAENMSEEEAIAIAGKAARLNYPIQSMDSGKLKAIASCYVEVGNALEQTTAGRIQLFQFYAKAAADAGKPIPPDAIPGILDSGRWEQAVAIERDEDLFIEWENDQILMGRAPVVAFSDDHLKHAKTHRATTLTPAARANPASIQAHDEHLMMHYAEFWGLPPGVNPRTDPQFFDRIRVLLGQSPPGAIGPPPGGPAAGGAPQPNQPPEVAAGPPNGAPPALQPPQPESPTPMPEAPPTVLQ